MRNITLTRKGNISALENDGQRILFQHREDGGIHLSLTAEQRAMLAALIVEGATWDDNPLGAFLESMYIVLDAPKNPDGSIWKSSLVTPPTFKLVG